MMYSPSYTTGVRQLRRRTSGTTPTMSAPANRGATMSWGNGGANTGYSLSGVPGSRQTTPANQMTYGNSGSNTGYSLAGNAAALQANWKAYLASRYGMIR